jgi:hypothetical protein
MNGQQASTDREAFFRSLEVGEEASFNSPTLTFTTFPMFPHTPPPPPVLGSPRIPIPGPYRPSMESMLNPTTLSQVLKKTTSNHY